MLLIKERYRAERFRLFFADDVIVVLIRNPYLWATGNSALRRFLEVRLSISTSTVFVRNIIVWPHRYVFIGLYSRQILKLWIWKASLRSWMGVIVFTCTSLKWRRLESLVNLSSFKLLISTLSAHILVMIHLLMADAWDRVRHTVYLMARTAIGCHILQLKVTYLVVWLLLHLKWLRNSFILCHWLILWMPLK